MEEGVEEGGVGKQECLKKQGEGSPKIESIERKRERNGNHSLFMSVCIADIKKNVFLSSFKYYSRGVKYTWTQTVR